MGVGRCSQKERGGDQQGVREKGETEILGPYCLADTIQHPILARAR